MGKPRSRGSRIVLSLAAACVLAAAALAALEREGVTEETAPTPEVLQAIRLLLSGNPKEEARGEVAMKRMGAAVTPQLRWWVRKVRRETDRVQAVIDELDGKTRPVAAAGTLTADAFFQGKLLEAKALERDGEHKRAREIAEALGVLDKESPYAWEARRLARQAKERMVAGEVLEPSVESDKAVYEVGERPEITFRLKNHKDKEVRIQVEKGTLGELDSSIMLLGLGGEMKLDRRSLRIQVRPDVKEIVIAPGKSWEHRIPFDAGDSMPLSNTVARVQFSGRFRPTFWGAEGVASTEASIGLTLNDHELWMVPPGQLEQCDRPLEKLASAILFKRVEAFFVAAQLAAWAAESDAYLNEKLIDTLLASIDELDEPRTGVAVRVLKEVTGEDFGSDPSKWKGWWSRIHAKK